MIDEQAMRRSFFYASNNMTFKACITAESGGLSRAAALDCLVHARRVSKPATTARGVFCTHRSLFIGEVARVALRARVLPALALEPVRMRNADAAR